MRAEKITVEPVPALAHPADLLGWISHHQGIVRSTPGDHRARPDECIGTDGIAAHDGGVGADGGPCLDQGGPHLVHAGYVGAGVEHVGEHHGRAAEHVVLQGDPLVDRDVVLDLAAVSYDRVRTDHHVLADAAVPAYLRALQDVAEMPDPGS